MNSSKMIAASALLALGMSAPALANSSHHRHASRHGHHQASAWTHHRHVARSGVEGGRYAYAPAPLPAPVGPGGLVDDGIGLGVGAANAGVGLGLDAVGAGLGLAGTGIGIGTGVADAGLGVVDPYYRGYPAGGVVYGDDLF